MTRVLIVEDEFFLALDLGEMLTDAGFKLVGPASSVAAALALIAGKGCDCAVLDFNLGHENSEPIARDLIARGVPFVTLTGYTRDQLPETFAPFPLLSKPVRADALLAEIRRSVATR